MVKLMCGHRVMLWKISTAGCFSVLAPELFCVDSSDPENKEEEPRSVKLSLSADGLSIELLSDDTLWKERGL